MFIIKTNDIALRGGKLKRKGGINKVPEVFPEYFVGKLLFGILWGSTEVFPDAFLVFGSTSGEVVKNKNCIF